jgi:hypothetical protein
MTRLTLFQGDPLLREYAAAAADITCNYTAPLDTAGGLRIHQKECFNFGRLSYGVIISIMRYKQYLGELNIWVPTLAAV